MRQLYALCILMALLFGAAGCYDDDSTLGTETVPDIKITELRDTTMVSYSGNILKITPEVTTDYPAESLKYAWYYFSEKDKNDGKAGGYRKNRIGESKELAYEVNLPSGIYTFVFEVTSAENNYVSTQKMKVSVTTEFVGRFYVLKETADGHSELDLVKGTTVNPDVITKVNGAPLEGAPVSLSYIFNQGYMDDETLKAKGARAMYVFTEKDCRVYNTENMSEIRNRSTLTYEGLPEGEVPCGAINSLVLMMFTDKGMYNTQPYDPSLGYESAGKYGLPTGAGATRFMVAMGFGGIGYVYWSEAEHHLYITDMNGQTPSPLTYTMPAGLNESDLSCVACGQNYVGGVETNWFLTETPTGTRWLYLLDGAQNVTEIRQLDASLHITKAEVVAAKGLNASVIYSIDENALWYYDWIHNTEDRINLPGISSEETLAYVSNQFLQVVNSGMSEETTYDYDHLIVGTQQGGSYKLYFYDDVVGAMPQKAVEPAVGKGKVKSVRFAAPITLGCFDLAMPFYGPLFPLCD